MQEAKDYLAGYRLNTQRVKTWQEELDRLKAEREREQLRTQDAHSEERARLRLVLNKCEAAARAKLAEHEAAAQQVEQTIDSLPDNFDKELMRRRYINGQTWDEIADNLYCTKRTCFRHHTQALAIIQRQITK